LKLNKCILYELSKIELDWDNVNIFWLNNSIFQW